MFAHNVPRTADGALPAPILFGNTSGEFNEMCNANEENQKHFIDRYVEERVRINYWWMDAGWYPCDGKWPKTGTWEPDLKRFPHGLRAISDHARTVGVKTLVWFEPERVAQGTWIADHHPDWLLGKTLLNLGRSDTRNWLTNHVDRVLREQGISLYRQDFNMDPLSFWRNNDAADRQGMTENQHIENYLAYWDELRQRHPELIIDSCASGGRRNDLETMRRAIALHPTDYNYGHLAAKQAFHATLFQWLPCFGSNTVPVGTVDAYAIRSGHAMNVVLGYDMRRPDLDYDLLRKLTVEWRQIVPYYRGDFYPLTGDSRDEEHWLAWQFDRPEQGDGIVEAFRRERTKPETASYHLRGIDTASRYEITDLDTGRSKALSGKALAEHGLPVFIESKPARWSSNTGGSAERTKLLKRIFLSTGFSAPKGRQSIARGASPWTGLSAPKGRQSIARGVSPWTGLSAPKGRQSIARGASPWLRMTKDTKPRSVQPRRGDSQ